MVQLSDALSIDAVVSVAAALQHFTRISYISAQIEAVLYLCSFLRMCPEESISVFVLANLFKLEAGRNILSQFFYLFS